MNFKAFEVVSSCMFPESGISCLERLTWRSSAVTSVRKPSVTIIFSNKMDFSFCADKTSLLRLTYTIVITLIDQVANLGAAVK